MSKFFLETVKKYMPLIRAKFRITDERQNGKGAVEKPCLWEKYGKARLYVPHSAWKSATAYIDLVEDELNNDENDLLETVWEYLLDLEAKQPPIPFFEDETEASFLIPVDFSFSRYGVAGLIQTTSAKVWVQKSKMNIETEKMLRNEPIFDLDKAEKGLSLALKEKDIFDLKWK